MSQTYGLWSQVSFSPISFRCLQISTDFPFRCTFVCHTGDCSDKSVCKKKVKLFCPCKRRKQETPCNKAQPAVCDDECRHIKEQVRNHSNRPIFEVLIFTFKARLEAEAEQDRLKVEVERQQREEAERFEAKMEGGGRRRNRRNRRNLCETTEKSFLQSHKLPILAFLTSFVSVVMAIYLYQ
jgi:NF-X1-type zinc finger protein NFXL1